MTSSLSSWASDSTIITASRRAGDDEIELGIRHVVDRRVEPVFAVDIADARGADRAHEGQAGNGQRGGRRDQRHDIGIILQVVGQNLRHHQRFVAIAVGEQRTDGAVDQARDQRLALGRRALALEIAARDLAGGVIAFLVIHGEREEIHALARRCARRRRWPAQWSRHRWRAPRRRPGGRSCRSRGSACGRPIRSFLCGR